MKKIVIFSICYLLALPVGVVATEQEFYDITEQDVLENKYEGYHTTLAERDRGVFGGSADLYRDIRIPERRKTQGSWVDYGSTSQADYLGLADFGRYDSQEMDFTSGSYNDMTQHFQSEFRGLFTRDDSLIRDFSVPQPRYFNQGFNQGQPVSGGFKNPPGYNSAPARGNTQKSSGNSGGHDIEQPALIGWVFSVIGYIREHPVISGFIVLLALSLISLLQVIWQRYTRPFG